MKKIFLLFFSTFLGLSSIAQTNGFELTVKIDGYPEGQKLSLGRYYADKQYYVDTTPEYDKKRGVYVFKKPEHLESGMYILISAEGFPMELIIDQDQHFSVETKYPEFGTDTKFKNSLENQVYVDFNTSVRPLYVEFDKLKKEFDSLNDKNNNIPETDAVKTYKDELVKKIQSALDNIATVEKQFMENNPKHLMTAVFKARKDVEVPEAPANIPEAEKNQWRYNYWKDHYFDNIDLATDDRLLRTPIFYQRLEKYLESVLSPHPDSIKFGAERMIEKTRTNPELFKYIVWYTTDKYFRSQIIGYDAIWVYLIKKYYLSGDATWATASTIENFKKYVERAEPLLIGNRPTEFYCPDTNADRPNETYRSVFEFKNRYTIVVFWEPTCGHCKKAMPQLRDFYNSKHKELDFEVFAVCRDHDVNAWKNYIYTNNMTNWVNVNGKTSNIKYDDLWDVHSTPTIYVLDSQKRIVTKRIEVEQIEPFIRNWNALYYDDKK